MTYRCILLKIFLVFALALSPNAHANENHSSENQRYYDYIVVGVGSAGSILARKLSDRHESVLALDIGEFRYDDPVINAGTAQLFTNYNTLFFDPRYATVYPAPTGGLGQALPYSEGGGTIGGGGAHNFMAAVRGTPPIYDSWAAATGDPRWLYDSLLPKMKAVEHFLPNGIPPDPTQRGFKGRIFIAQDPPLSTAPRTFYANMASVTGSTPSPDYNNPNFGINGLVLSASQGFETSTGPTGQRSYSAKEFLPMSGPDAVIDMNGNGLHGRDLKVQQNARALRFGIEDGRAISVDYVLTKGNYDEVVTACLKEEGKLIIANGSVQTPHLLIQSGVGPRATLDSLNIPVKVDSPQVGQNLINQWGALPLICTGSTQVQEGEVFVNGSPFTTGYNDRRIQFIVAGTAPSTVPGCNGNILLVATFLLEPNSRGTIDVVSNNPLLDPALNLNMYSDGSFATNGTDANLIVSALKILNATATASGFTMFNPPPATFLAGDAALFAWATDLSNWIIESHITGTARMGMTIADSVVDGRLKVHGLDNVYLGSNAAPPTIVNGNVNFQAYYLAEELAAILGY